MLKILATVDYPVTKRVDVLCCGSHWEGKPGACGSYCRQNGISLRRRHIHFGRYYAGADAIDQILFFNPGLNKIDLYNQDGLTSSYRTFANEYRNTIIDRWDDNAENAIEKAVSDAAKAYIAERTQKATENLRAANERYENYFGESKEG